MPAEPIMRWTCDRCGHVLEQPQKHRGESQHAPGWHEWTIWADGHREADQLMFCTLCHPVALAAALGRDHQAALELGEGS